MVSSQTWRQHHRPEACLEVYGLSVQGSFTTLAAPDFPVRTLSLEAESANERLSAVYWLQSRSQITDEYATRIWADLAPERQRWVLVTILFDEAVEPASDEALALYDAIRAAIQANLEGSESP